jgi:hypothetical protein
MEGEAQILRGRKTIMLNRKDERSRPRKRLARLRFISTVVMARSAEAGTRPIRRMNALLSVTQFQVRKEKTDQGLHAV